LFKQSALAELDSILAELASSDALPLQKSIQSPDNSDSAKEVINTGVQSGHNGKNFIIATSNRTSTTCDTPFLGASPPAVVP